MDIIEFADMLRVPILKAGTHRSHNAGDIEITEEELSQIAKDSNFAREYIQESVELQRYRGNEHLPLRKPIPGPLNVHHQAIFPETIKDRVKDVEWSFDTEYINGEKWLVEDFHNVPPDIAKTLQGHFPYRSIEFLPLKIGNKVYPKIIRSTSFLDKFTLPAVKGQTPELAVEFVEGESPVIVLMCDTIDTELPTSNQEAIRMLTKQETAQGAEELSGGDVSELAGQIDAKNAEIDSLKAKLAQVAKAKDVEHDEIAELNASHEAAQFQIAELMKAQEAADVREFCTTFELTPLVYEGQKYVPSPSFMTIVNKHVTASPSTGVIEFAEETRTVRDTMKALFSAVAELAAKHAVLVPISDAKGSQPVPNQKQTIESIIAELQTADDKLSYGDAWVEASARLQED